MGQGDGDTRSQICTAHMLQWGQRSCCDKCTGCNASEVTMCTCTAANRRKHAFLAARSGICRRKEQRTSSFSIARETAPHHSAPPQTPCSSAAPLLRSPSALCSGQLLLAPSRSPPANVRSPMAFPKKADHARANRSLTSRRKRT